MSVNQLLPDWGWECILQALNHPWAAAPETSFRVREIDIKVSSAGRWACSAALAPATCALLTLFLPLVSRPGPFTIAQIGQSLDGRIATESGASHYINGFEARAHLHRLRAVVDAVLVGVGTVNADDPQLTVRHVPGAHPLRVVVDPQGRANPAAKIFNDGAAPTLHLTAQVLPLSDGGGFAPRAVLDWLHARGLQRVLVEGGGVTVSRFVESGVLDRLHVLVAPLLIGSGRPGLSLPPVQTLDEAIRPVCRTFACGEDTIFDLVLSRTSMPSAASSAR